MFHINNGMSPSVFRKLLVKSSVTCSTKLKSYIMNNGDEKNNNSKIVFFVGTNVIQQSKDKWRNIIY